jgi:hypothetical protein
MITSAEQVQEAQRELHLETPALPRGSKVGSSMPATPTINFACRRPLSAADAT